MCGIFLELLASDHDGSSGRNCELDYNSDLWVKVTARIAERGPDHMEFTMVTMANGRKVSNNNVVHKLIVNSC